MSQSVAASYQARRDECAAAERTYALLDQRLTHLRALRWPETAKPERLQARAWLEAPDGRVLAMAADRCP